MYETDLGEFIIQLRKEKPTHIINPSVHVPREEVAKTFSELLGRPVSSEIPALVGIARDYLREKFCHADVGITGANVVSAKTGTIFIVENEGNARFVSNAPPKHICLTGIEKIVPTLSDAFKVLQVLPPYATGVFMSAYVSMITGPSKTADIEKTIVYGAHGPKELHLVLLDNGRRRMAEDEAFREPLLHPLRGLYVRVPSVPDYRGVIRKQLLRGDRVDMERVHYWRRKSSCRSGRLHQVREVQGGLPARD